jgi:hypothetical protein
MRGLEGTYFSKGCGEYARVMRHKRLQGLRGWCHKAHMLARNVVNVSEGTCTDKG